MVRAIRSWFVFWNEISSWGLVPTRFFRKACLALMLYAEKNAAIDKNTLFYGNLYLCTRKDTSSCSWRYHWQGKLPSSPWQCLCTFFCIPRLSGFRCPSLCRVWICSEIGWGGETCQNSFLWLRTPLRWGSWQFPERGTELPSSPRIPRSSVAGTAPCKQSMEGDWVHQDLWNSICRAGTINGFPSVHATLFGRLSCAQDPPEVRGQRRCRGAKVQRHRLGQNGWAPISAVKLSILPR